ncbi:hypothetical protein DL768_003014 [Monosporascus sp. mg162]|nr:hypothetical protein DL768_003014 [Monosporascus sp. mg162]
MTINLDRVTTDRGGIVENRHYVRIAVVDQVGSPVYSTGGPSRLTLARSVAKPAQTLAVLQTGGFEQPRFDEADLALMYMSHSSRERHVVRARAMLTKAGVDALGRHQPCYGVGIRASEETTRLGTEEAVGISVKIQDGGKEILHAVVIKALTQLQIGTLDTRESCPSSIT